MEVNAYIVDERGDGFIAKARCDKCGCMRIFFFNPKEPRKPICRNQKCQSDIPIWFGPRDQAKIQAGVKR